MKNFKRHPEIETLFIKNDGSEFREYGQPIEIKDKEAKPGYFIKTVRVQNAERSVNKLILETYGPPKPEGRYYAICKDGNKENLHPKNLMWSKKHSGDQDLGLKRKTRSSKLDIEDTRTIYYLSKQEKIPKTKLARDYGISHTSVNRAIKRYADFLKQNG